MIKFSTARWAGATGLAIAGLAAVLPVLPAAATAAPAPVATQGMSFSCILSDFGVSAPITITATLAAPTRGTVGKPFTVTLTTQPVSLPSAVSSQVPTLSNITMAGRSSVNKHLLPGPGQQPGGFVPWSAQTGPVSAGAATLPAMTAKATVLPIQAGPALISTASVITLTPAGTSATYAPMQCDGPGAETDILITIKNPPMPHIKHIGPGYRCTGGGTLWFPMRITTTGPTEVSSREHVALTISPPQFVAARTAAASGARRPPHPLIILHAVLPVTGAQTGVVQVSGRIKPNSARLSAAGSLALTVAGQDAILLPSHFQLTVRLGHRTEPVMSCRIKGGHDPAGTTLTVAAGPADSAGTPSGAPNTGGGVGRPGGVNRALALSGAITLLGGAGVTVAALARRRRQRRVTA
jgi:hypothetical protein